MNRHIRLNKGEKVLGRGGESFWRHMFAWGQTLLMVMVFLGVNALNAQASEQDLVPYDAQAPIQQGELVLQNQAGDMFWAPLLETDVVIAVSGLTANVVLKQSFSNNSQDWMEGRYQFPLPERAAVHRMVMLVGERRIVGKIKEKREAKKIYQAAKRAGKRASLVSQQRPNMFTNKVANIAPGETISVEIHYVETLKYDHGEFSLRFPTTFTPRYLPPFQGRQSVQASALSTLRATNEDETPVSVEASQPKTMGVDPETGWLSSTEKTDDYLDVRPAMVLSNQAAPLTLSAKIDAGFPLEYIHSLYHPIARKFEEGIYHINFQQQSEPMNRDIVLRWKPALAKRINAAVFKETQNNEDYHLLMLLPNVDAAQTQRLPREVVFVIDTSGSMSGVSMRQAKAALLAGLRRLHAGDRFNIVEFDSNARKLFSDSVNFDAATMAQATAYIQRLQADGGTNIANALTLALGGEADSAYVRQVVFITDGSVGNEEALFNQIVRDIGNSRLFTVGIGSAPNSHFMRDAAEMGRGSFTHIGDINDVQAEMANLFSKLENPVLGNISLDWGGVQPEVFPKQLPDLYLSEPLVLYVKSPENSLSGTLQARGAFAGEQWAQSLPLHVNKQEAGVAKQWARQKIHALMSPRNTLSAEDKKRAVTDVALQHQLLSRYTSFVAVEEVVARPQQMPLKSGAIPNAMPKGNTMAMPNTATPAMLYFLVGMVAMLFGLFQVVALLKPQSRF